jgi:hypothetical protein
MCHEPFLAGGLAQLHIVWSAVFSVLLDKSPFHCQPDVSPRQPTIEALSEVVRLELE